MSETSLSLIERVQQQNDNSCWADLVAIYAPLLLRWTLRYDVQQSDAEDLVQDVLLVVYRELASFQHQGRAGSFRSWLRTILVHRLRNHWRSRKSQVKAIGGSKFEELLQNLADPASGISRIWDREHDARVLACLMKQISSRFTPTSLEAFERTAVRGEAASEVARDLGVTVNSVFIAKSRVLNELRRRTKDLL